jgi:hypothetical protein
MEIKLTLNVDEVNIILNALATRPYAEVAGLIGKIRTEGEKQLTSQSEDGN